MSQSLCESHRLKSFLNGALCDSEVDALTNHLDQCTACSTELERLAASPARWKEAKDHLKDAANHLARTTSRCNALNIETATTSTLPFTIRQVVSMLDPTDEPNSMGRLGGCEVLGVVGSGAMGVVLKAVDPTLDRVVALKVMHPTLAACGTARYRFAREAKAAAGVLHPNVIAIHSVSTDRELPYLVMPYIAGTSLQQRMDRQGPLTLSEILRIGVQLAAGLAAAHEKGLIHRDIKPANIMLDKGVETAVITDFGLARTIDDATMTRSGAIAGTPEYMSPEQARGEAIECVSDIFSLASLLYALCTGSRPFRAKTSFGVLRKITDEEPTPIRELNPEIPKWLCRLIAGMHAKSPAKRPSAAEVHEQLVACLAHVYQPDRNLLPENLAEPAATLKLLPLRTRYLLSGALIMTTIAFAAILFASAQFVDSIDEPAKEVAPKTSREKDSTIAPSVFKTLNLKFPRATQQGKLIVDINRGFIEVAGHDGNDVVIEILTPPRFEKDAKDENSVTEFKTIFTPQYDLKSNSDTNSIKLDTYNQDYVLNLRIKVPYRTDLSLDSYMDGYLKVENVTGVIQTRSQHSDISLLDIAGSAKGYSRNGNLTIRFQSVADSANLDFESYNGTIDLTLPESIAATTAIYSGKSNSLTAFAIKSIDSSERPEAILAKVGSNADEYQYGQINGGGIPLRLESEKGQIKIRKLSKPMPYRPKPSNRAKASN